jgi:hypothetical protein
MTEPTPPDRPDTDGADTNVPDASALSAAELNALKNLARKRGGEAVPFVNISSARTLTELGLAERSREGWDITPRGSALLARLDPLNG